MEYDTALNASHDFFLKMCRGGEDQFSGKASKTVCPSGLRGWTQVPLARAAWVQIPQLSYYELNVLLCVRNNLVVCGHHTDSGLLRYEEACLQTSHSQAIIHLARIELATFSVLG